MTYALGIDLGTTFSAAATAEDGRIEIFQLGDRAATIPSVVLLRADGEVLTGDAAERRALSEPTRTAREFKRRLGDPTPLILGGTPYGAEALLAHLLRAIVDQVVRQKGERPSAIAISHPASYGPYKLDLLRQAVRQADLDDVGFVPEPEAAAVHYASQERVPTGAVIAVYDFGGGTFDATILRKTTTGFEQLGTPEGLERLGGIDFDEAIVRHVDEVLGGVLGRLDPADTRARSGVARLREDVRRAKEALSVDTDAEIAVLLPETQADVRLTRTEFEGMIRPRIRETIRALERALKSAGVTADELDRVLLVGGTSRIPLIAEMVREATGRPVALDAHPKHTIALGAARRAAGLDRTAAAAVDGTATPGPEALAAAPAGAAAVAAEGAVASTPVVAGAPASELGPGLIRPPSATDTSTEGDVDARTASGPRPAGTDVRLEAADGRGRAAAAAAAPPERARGTDRRSRSPAALLAALVAVAGIAALAVIVVAGGFGGRAPGASPTIAAVVASSSAAAIPSTTDHGSHTDAPPSPSAQATVAASPGRSAAPTSRPPSSAPTAALPRTAAIQGIRLQGGRYAVDFTTSGYDPVLPGRHVHFFFDTVSVADAGVPGRGPWFVYGGESPFTGYGVGDRPAAAQRMCILVANRDHSIVRGTGNCVDLPD